MTILKQKSISQFQMPQPQEFCLKYEGGAPEPELAVLVISARKRILNLDLEKEARQQNTRCWQRQ